MPIVSQSNGLFAEFSVFPSEPHTQETLIEQAIQNIKSLSKSHTDFSSGTVFRSCDGLRGTSFIQWTNQETYIKTQALPGFATPDVHLFEIFAEEPQNSKLHLSSDMDGLINFGIFKMKQPEIQSRFIELF